MFAEFSWFHDGLHDPRVVGLLVAPLHGVHPCHGSGHPKISARYWSTVICECDGLGWVPAGWRSEHASGGRWLTIRLGQLPV